MFWQISSLLAGACFGCFPLLRTRLFQWVLLLSVSGACLAGSDISAYLIGSESKIGTKVSVPDLPTVNKQLFSPETFSPETPLWGISWSGLQPPVELCATGDVTVYPDKDIQIEKIDNRHSGNKVRYQLRLPSGSGNVVLQGGLVTGCGDVPESPVKLVAKNNSKTSSTITLRNNMPDRGVILLFELSTLKQENPGRLSNHTDLLLPGGFPDGKTFSLDFGASFFPGDGGDDQNHRHLSPGQSLLDIIVLPYHNNNSVVSFTVIMTEPDGTETKVYVSQSEINWLMDNYRKNDDDFFNQLEIYLAKTLYLRESGKTNPKKHIMQLLRSIYRVSDNASFDELLSGLQKEIFWLGYKHTILDVAGATGKIRQRGKTQGGDSGQQTTGRMPSAQSSSTRITGGGKNNRQDNKDRKQRGNDGRKPPNTVVERFNSVIVQNSGLKRKHNDKYDGATPAKQTKKDSKPVQARESVIIQKSLSGSESSTRRLGETVTEESGSSVLSTNNKQLPESRFTQDKMSVVKFSHPFSIESILGIETERGHSPGSASAPETSTSQHNKMTDAEENSRSLLEISENLSGASTSATEQVVEGNHEKTGSEKNKEQPETVFKFALESDAVNVNDARNRRQENVILSNLKALYESLDISWKEISTDVKPEGFSSKWVWNLIVQVHDAMIKGKKYIEMGQTFEELLKKFDSKLSEMLFVTLKMVFTEDHSDEANFSQERKLIEAKLDFYSISSGFSSTWREWFKSKYSKQKGMTDNDYTIWQVLLDKKISSLSSDGEHQIISEHWKAIAQKYDITEFKIHNVDYDAEFIQSILVWEFISEISEKAIMDSPDAIFFNDLFINDEVMRRVVKQLLGVIFEVFDDDDDFDEAQRRRTEALMDASTRTSWWSIFKTFQDDDLYQAASPLSVEF